MSKPIKTSDKPTRASGIVKKKGRGHSKRTTKKLIEPPVDFDKAFKEAPDFSHKQLSTPQGPIQAAQAIQIAKGYIVKLLSLNEDPIIEGIELRDKAWTVIVSIQDTTRGNFNLLPMIPRKYKTVKINAITGDLVSISIHSVNG